MHVLPLAPHLPSVEMPSALNVQVPEDDWHPAPQKVELDLQYPEAEQQVPKDEPVQVLPLAPHEPSVEMLPAPAEQEPYAD